MDFGSTHIRGKFVARVAVAISESEPTAGPVHLDLDLDR